MGGMKLERIGPPNGFLIFFLHCVAGHRLRRHELLQATLCFLFFLVQDGFAFFAHSRRHVDLQRKCGTRER